MTPKAEKPTTWECVLPSGEFVSLRRITLGDWFAVGKFELKGGALAGLMVRCMTVDGKSVTHDQLMEFDLDDYAMVIREINNRIIAAMDRKGIA